MKYRNPRIFRDGIYPYVRLSEFSSVFITKGDENTEFLRIGINPYTTGLETNPDRALYKQLVKLVQERERLEMQ